MRRRELLQGAASAALALQPGLSFGQAFDEDEDFEAEILSSVEAELRLLGDVEAAGLTLAARGEAQVSPTKRYRHQVPALDARLHAKLKARVRYWRLPANERLVHPKWMTDDKNPDLFHLKDIEVVPQTKFSVDASVIRFLAERNAFPLKTDPLIIGLRGAELDDGADDSGWGRRHKLKLVAPDHIHPRCLVGVYRVSDGQLRLFRASTVPQATSMYSVLTDMGWGVSLLPAGRYRFVAGTHKASQPRRQQPGSLLNVTRYVCLRTSRDLVYDPTSPSDAWTFGAGHNVHAAGIRNRNPRFDSAGCQVVVGRYTRDRKKAKGPWLDFQKSAGLADADGRPAKIDKVYDYLLLPGVEASLAWHAAPTFIKEYRRLRPGSVDKDRVKPMQDRVFKLLNAPIKNAALEMKTAEGRAFLQKRRLVPDGDFGALTSLAVLLEQQVSKKWGDAMGPVTEG